MKKIFLFLLVVSILSMSLIGCGSKFNEANSPGAGGVNPEVPSTPASMPDDSSVPQEQNKNTIKLKAVLYFSDKEGMKIIKEERDMEFEEDENTPSGSLSVEKKARLTLEELIKGSENGELSTTIPKETKVRSVTLDGDTIVIDLSKEFKDLHVGGSTGILMTMGPIVLTLTEIESIEKVSFKIEGKIEEEFGGHIEFNRPFTRSEYEQYLEE